MESTVRISTGSIFLLVLYKAAIMEAYRSVIMEAFRDQFSATELLSYKKVMYEKTTGEWYAQREVDRENRNCTRLSRQFGHLMEEYREGFFTYVLVQSPTVSIAEHLESYLLHVYYASQLDNLYDDREIDQLELDWITWQRDYAQNKTWGDSRISIFEAMQNKL